jgi:hypothetical protein
MNKKSQIYIDDLVHMIAETLAESPHRCVEFAAKQTLEVKEVIYDGDGWFTVEWK